MLAPVRAYSTTMSFHTSGSSPPKRPRLSLQIKTPAAPQTLGKSTTALKIEVDPSSPTAFNTLSNAYAVAIEAASPRTAKPPTIIGKPTSLRLETTNFTKPDEYVHPSQRTQTPGPFSIAYPDTPSSAFPSLSLLTPTTAHPENKDTVLNPFTYTPPQSAGSGNLPQIRIFTFAANNKSTPSTPRTPRRRVTIGSWGCQPAPYTHPRALHSILRNSPLPPRSSITPATPTRISLRIADRSAKRVGYNDPLTQTITTNKYVKSHIDLLIEDPPHSAVDPDGEKVGTLDLTMAYTGDETRDGGQTPGPFEEMRRRMADSGLETPGTRKRKRKEKKRNWEWTLGSEPPGTDGSEKTPLTAVHVEELPLTAIERGDSILTDESDEEHRFAPAPVSEDSEMEGTSSECDSVTSVRTDPIPQILNSL